MNPFAVVDFWSTTNWQDQQLCSHRHHEHNRDCMFEVIYIFISSKRHLRSSPLLRLFDRVANRFELRLRWLLASPDLPV